MLLHLFFCPRVSIVNTQLHILVFIQNRLTMYT